MKSKHKKYPEDTRQALLDSAAKLAIEQGMGAVSLKAVAEGAGVTKGGLFHYFDNKQALIDELFEQLIGRLDEKIDQLMASDDVEFGAFTRAYIRTALVHLEEQSPWTAISFAMEDNDQLIERWNSWLSERLTRHSNSDYDARLEIARLAADGIWFTALLNNQQPQEQFMHLLEPLLQMTFPQSA